MRRRYGALLDRTTAVAIAAVLAVLLFVFLMIRAVIEHGTLD